MFPNVAFIRPELSRLFAMYLKIRDCIAGEEAVKEQGKVYLPIPNEEDTSSANKKRYEAYKKRAVFYNVTRRTLNGLLGQVFNSDPQVKVPPVMEQIVANSSGSGINLTQQAKQSLALTLAYSRSGLFVDYPETSEDGATVEQLQAGDVRPTISVFDPMEIINWRVTNRGAREILSLVVLFELFCFHDDGFEMKQANQFRVLRLDPVTQNYVQEIWRENSPTKSTEMVPKIASNFTLFSQVEMKGFDGQPMKEIPFMFLGSDNNDPNPDDPNMIDLASLNLAHYRNSADYEESCFIVGQATPVITGLDKDWYENVLNKKINFGSRGGIPLPKEASAELLQAAANSMVKEAMDMKERQMVALGAKLVEQQTVQRTATEASIETTEKTSTLASTTHNVTAGYLWALQQCAQFMGVDPAGIEFALNDDFDIAKMTPEEITAYISSWSAGAISFTEMRSGLRKAGVATQDDTVAKTEIQADQAQEQAQQIELLTAQAAAKPNPQQQQQT